MSHPYHWIGVEADRHKFLSPLFNGLGVRRLEVFTESSVTSATFGRVACGGLVLAVSELEGRPVAVVWSDFRVNAGCFSHATSQRFAAFLRHLGAQRDQGPPLFYVVSSAGVTLSEGRALFADAFRLWPELLAYSRRHLVVTCAIGKCLGLAAPLFGLGHYRMAVAGKTHINLTGPEVMRMFFGESVDYESGASAETLHRRTDLVHELVPSLDVAFERWRWLLAPAALPPAGPGAAEDATPALLRTFLDGPPHEVVPGWCASLKLFLGTRRGRPLGLFVNPLRRANNLITARTLEKYVAGLDLFRALRVPIVSFLDSPGVDPRFEESDANNIRKMLAVGERMIDYPYGAMGVIAGRCFGGASTLSIPKIFGGRRAVALSGSTLGVMQSVIIDEVLRQSPRQHERWRRTAARQGPDLEDLLETGALDAVVEPHELADEVDNLFHRLERQPIPLQPGMNGKNGHVNGERRRDGGLRIASGESRR